MAALKPSIEVHLDIQELEIFHTVYLAARALDDIWRAQKLGTEWFSQLAAAMDRLAAATKALDDRAAALIADRAAKAASRS